ncbi:MAG: Zn-ribbon domain-containing OB-fold protein [Syntrophobacterales bacterium]|nr:Zn-ribbon domain-containing OB-fold protein [Syntrophobacterales bacterium]
MAGKEQDTRFTKFGTVSFTALTKVNDFIDHLEGGKITGTKCRRCGRTYFPPRADCYNCLNSDMEWFEVSGSGKLLSFSMLQYAPVGFEGDLPYTIALLDYGDYKVFGRTDPSIPYEKLSVGMKMKAAVTKLDNEQLTYVFREV